MMECIYCYLAWSVGGFLIWFAVMKLAAMAKTMGVSDIDDAETERTGGTAISGGSDVAQETVVLREEVGHSKHVGGMVVGEILEKKKTRVSRRKTKEVKENDIG